MRVKQTASLAAKEVIKETEKMMRLKKVYGGPELDTDEESVGSSTLEEMDSPRSVLVSKTKIGSNNIRKWSGPDGNTPGKNIIEEDGLYLHSQILRIRCEDSHIGEDINARVLLNQHEVASLMLLSRPVLLASPLSGKTPAISKLSREN